MSGHHFIRQGTVLGPESGFGRRLVQSLCLECFSDLGGLQSIGERREHADMRGCPCSQLVGAGNHPSVAILILHLQIEQLDTIMSL